MIFEENEHTELKSQVTPELPKEIIAFANTHGGTIYIGVDDNGNVLGVEDSDSTLLQIGNLVCGTIKPDVTMFVHYDIIEESGKKIIAITVQRGTDKPYYLTAKGLKPSGVYVRNGTASDPSTDTAIRKMIKETDGDSFEEMRSLNQNLSFDFAQEEFNRCKIDFGSKQMKTLGIINVDDIYTNLGLLLSEQCPHTIKTATFQGTDQTEFKDRHEFGGSLFKQMEDTYSYIDLRNRTHSTYDKLRRIDVRDYPEIALREALLNSLIHRDYSFRASTLISVYEDRIEFVSIGGLITGVSANDIMLGLSVCRNPKLASVFYRLHLVEAYGTGMPKIFKAYQGTGKTPKIEVTDNAFKLILPNINYYSAPISEKQPVNRNYDIILQHIKENGYVTRKQTEDLLQTSQPTAARVLKQMVENGLLYQEGQGKNTVYKLK